MSDRVKLTAFGLLPSGVRGKMLVNAYLNNLKSKKPINGRKQEMSEFERAILRQPGNVSAITKYLNGSGKKKIPEIVQSKLGDKWYTGIAKKLSETGIGHNIVMHQVLDKTLPKINGDNSLARQFMEAGGQV